MYSLTSLHTFGLPCKAQSFFALDTPKDLPATLEALPHKAFYILGEGSNTVFLEDYQGSVISPQFMGKDLQQTDTHYILKVGAGENWHQLVLWCIKQQIYGFENLALIPGTVGAAPIQNIGAYGVEIEQFIQQVDYYDLAKASQQSLAGHECEFAYRDSVFKHKLAGQVVVTSVTFALPKRWRAVAQYAELKELVSPTALTILNKVIALRQKKLPDPKDIGNAGSFFKNPIIGLEQYSRLQQVWPTIPHYPLDSNQVKVPAAWLIDQLGFKGKKIGGIGCHPHQALVLTNDGSGTGAQLLKLARAIKSAVLREFSIELENEVRLIGKNGPVIL